MTLELNATRREVMRAVEALQKFGREQKLSEITIFGLALALEECGSNVVQHALGDDAKKKFRVSFERAGDQVRIELRDNGPEFDFTAFSRPSLPAHEDDPPGGWGIQIVRRYTDGISYRREANENILLLIKSIWDSADSDTTFSSTSNSKTENQNIHMPLDIQVLKGATPANSGTATVKLSGSLDTVTAPELEHQLDPVLADHVTEIVFDLAQLKFISSAGLRVFAWARKQLKERGGQASFIHLQPQIREVFDIIKSLPGIAVFKDVAELDSYLAARQRSHQEQV